MKRRNTKSSRKKHRKTRKYYGGSEYKKILQQIRKLINISNNNTYSENDRQKAHNAVIEQVQKNVYTFPLDFQLDGNNLIETILVNEKNLTYYDLITILIDRIANEQPQLIKKNGMNEILLTKFKENSPEIITILEKAFTLIRQLSEPLSEHTIKDIYKTAIRYQNSTVIPILYKVGYCPDITSFNDIYTYLKSRQHITGQPEDEFIENQQLLDNELIKIYKKISLTPFIYAFDKYSETSKTPAHLNLGDILDMSEHFDRPL